MGTAASFQARPLGKPDQISPIGAADPRDGEEVGRTSLATAAAPLLTASVDRASITNSDDDLAFIAIEPRDAAGALAADASAAVAVTDEGAATLAGMCSANPSTAERVDASTWKTFDGCALVVVRPAEIGATKVTVSAVRYEDAAVRFAIE